MNVIDGIENINKIVVKEEESWTSQQEIDTDQIDDKIEDISTNIIKVKKKKTKKKSKAKRSLFPATNLADQNSSLNIITLDLKRSFQKSKYAAIFESELTERSINTLLFLLDSDKAMSTFSLLRNVSFAMYNSILILRSLNFNYLHLKNIVFVKLMNELEGEMKSLMQSDSFKLLVIPKLVLNLQESLLCKEALKKLNFEDLDALAKFLHNEKQFEAKDDVEMQDLNPANLAEIEKLKTLTEIFSQAEDWKNDILNLFVKVIKEAKEKIKWLSYAEGAMSTNPKSLIEKSRKDKNDATKAQMEKLILEVANYLELFINLTQNQIPKIREIEESNTALVSDSLELHKNRSLFCEQIRECYVNLYNRAKLPYQQQILNFFDEKINSCKILDSNNCSFYSFISFVDEQNRLSDVINNIAVDCDLDLFDHEMVLFVENLCTSFYREKSSKSIFKNNHMAMARCYMSLHVIKSNQNDRIDHFEAALIGFLKLIKHEELFDAFQDYFQSVHAMYCECQKMFNDNYLKHLGAILSLSNEKQNFGFWLSSLKEIKKLEIIKNEFLYSCKEKKANISKLISDLIEYDSVLIEEDISKELIGNLKQAPFDFLYPYFDLIRYAPDVIFIVSDENAHECDKTKEEILTEIAFSLDNDDFQIFDFIYPNLSNSPEINIEDRRFDHSENDGTEQTDNRSVKDDKVCQTQSGSDGAKGKAIGHKNIKSRTESANILNKKINHEKTEKNYDKKSLLKRERTSKQSVPLVMSENVNLKRSPNSYSFESWEVFRSKRLSVLEEYLTQKGWSQVHQRGSHLKYELGGKETLIVPNNKKELKKGTLKAILKQEREKAHKLAENDPLVLRIEGLYG